MKNAFKRSTIFCSVYIGSLKKSKQKYIYFTHYTSIVIYINNKSYNLQGEHLMSKRINELESNED